MDSLTAADLERARDQFYPDWWRHRTGARMVMDAPLYTVICRDNAEAALAQAAKPPFLHADIQIDPSTKGTTRPDDDDVPGTREITSGSTMRHRVAESMSRLHRLGAWLSSADIPHTAALQRVHSLESVAAVETTVKREVWVLAVTMEYEVGTVYQNVIAANLRAGRSYTYFLPTDIGGGFGPALDHLLSSLKTHGVADAELRQHLKVFEVHDTNQLANLTLFDPTQGAKRGYLLPVYADKERAFQVTLDDALHDRVAARMHAWRRSDAKRYPTLDADERHPESRGTP